MSDSEKTTQPSGSGRFGRYEPELAEYLTITRAGQVVRVYKVGGGTRGHSYTGYWGYQVSWDGEVIVSGTDLYTGTPMTHEQTAATLVEVLSDEEK